MSAVSSHGAIFSFQATPLGSFVPIGDVGDITDPGGMRNEFDVTSHDNDIDKWITGIMRRDPLTLTVFWNGEDSGHDALRQALLDNANVGFKMEYPDGDDWVGSGFVRQVTRNQPVDGAQSANVTIRLSGPYYLNGELIGD
jgi:hypothetical protein